MAELSDNSAFKTISKAAATILIPTLLAAGMPSRASAQTIQDNLHQSIPAKELRLDAHGNVIKDTIAEEVSSGFALGQYANTAEESAKGFSLSPYKIAGTNFRLKATNIATVVSEGPAYESTGTTSDSPQFQEKVAKPDKEKKKGISPVIIVLGALAVGAIVYVATKKKKDDPTPPPVQETTYSFEVYDQMEAGVHKTFEKKAKAGTAIAITTTDADISDVVADYISVQDTSGKTLESSKTGTVTFTPVSGTKFKVIRYHAGPGFKEVYDWLASRTSLRLYAGRESTWSRLDEDGVTGKESVWSGTDGVFPMMKDILNKPYKVGDVTVVSSNGQNKYGFWTKYGNGGGKDLSIRLICVNPVDLNTDSSQTKIGFIELAEYLGAFNNIFDKSSVVTFFSGSDKPNDTCKAAMRFIFSYCK